MRPLIFKIVLCVILYLVGFTGTVVLHLPASEQQTLDHEADHILIEAIETAVE